MASHCRKRTAEPEWRLLGPGRAVSVGPRWERANQIAIEEIFGCNASLVNDLVHFFCRHLASRRLAPDGCSGGYNLAAILASASISTRSVVAQLAGEPCAGRSAFCRIAHDGPAPTADRIRGPTSGHILRADVLGPRDLMLPCLPWVRIQYRGLSYARYLDLVAEVIPEQCTLYPTPRRPDLRGGLEAFSG